MRKHCTHYKVALLLLTVAQRFRSTIYGTALFSPGCVINLQCSNVLKGAKRVHKHPSTVFWSATSELTERHQKNLIKKTPLEFSAVCHVNKMEFLCAPLLLMILETHRVCCCITATHRDLFLLPHADVPTDTTRKISRAFFSFQSQNQLLSGSLSAVTSVRSLITVPLCYITSPGCSRSHITGHFKFLPVKL